MQNPRSLASFPFRATATLAGLIGLLIQLPSGQAQACVVEWHDLGGGMTHAGATAYVRALTTFDDGSGPRLIAGGAFTHAGGTPASNIAVWDGFAWQALGAGFDGEVRALEVLDPDGSGPAPASLFAGGNFQKSGGTDVNYIAAWNGSTWIPLGPGVNAQVNALEVFDPDGSGSIPPALFVGGNFLQAGGTNHAFIARWSSSGWIPVGGGTNASVDSLLTFGAPGSEVLMVGGAFGMAGGLLSPLAACWTGSAWVSPAGGLPSPGTLFPSVRCMASYDPGTGPELHLGGGFETPGLPGNGNVVRWGGGAWSSVGLGLDPQYVHALAFFDDGVVETLYAGGSFLGSGATPLSRLARFDQGQWKPVGSGTDAPVLALGTHDDGGGASFVAAGLFRDIDGVAVQCIAVGRVAQDPPIPYCTAKVNTLGCTPAIGSTGVPSASAGSGFHITATNLRNFRVGTLFYGLQGRAATPYQGGTLCVAPPFRRAASQNSLGTLVIEDCSGTHDVDFNTLIASGMDPALVCGQRVQVQFLTRDHGTGVQGTVGLTDALDFVIRP